MEACLSHCEKYMWNGISYSHLWEIKSAHMKIKVLFQFCMTLWEKETFREDRQGRSVTTQTKPTSSIPSPLCSRNRKKHLDANNMDIQTLLNTHLKASMSAREPSTLFCLYERKVPLKLRGLDQVSGATREASGSGEYPVGASLPLPRPQTHALCLFVSVSLLNSPRISISL